jgi:hypothetical protein
MFMNLIHVSRGFLSEGEMDQEKVLIEKVTDVDFGNLSALVTLSFIVLFSGCGSYRRGYMRIPPPAVMLSPEP